jgi:hypothetical protein
MAVAARTNVQATITRNTPHITSATRTRSAIAIAVPMTPMMNPKLKIDRDAASLTVPSSP